MAKKTFHVRIIDEWTDDKKATIYSVQFVQKEGTNLIRVQNLIKNGKHSALLLGMSVNALHKWQNNDPTETHPETYNEIYDSGRREWRRMMSTSELLELMPFGDE